MFCRAVKFLWHCSQTGEKFKYWWFQHCFLYSMPCFAWMEFSGLVWIKYWLLCCLVMLVYSLGYNKNKLLFPILECSSFNNWLLSVVNMLMCYSKKEKKTSQGKIFNKRWCSKLLNLSGISSWAGAKGDVIQNRILVKHTPPLTLGNYFYCSSLSLVAVTAVAFMCLPSIWITY